MWLFCGLHGFIVTTICKKTQNWFVSICSPPPRAWMFLCCFLFTVEKKNTSHRFIGFLTAPCVSVIVLVCGHAIPKDGKNRLHWPLWPGSGQSGNRKSMHGMMVMCVFFPLFFHVSFWLPEPLHIYISSCIISILNLFLTNWSNRFWQKNRKFRKYQVKKNILAVQFTIHNFLLPRLFPKNRVFFFVYTSDKTYNDNLIFVIVQSKWHFIYLDGGGCTSAWNTIDLFPPKAQSYGDDYALLSLLPIPAFSV